MNLISHNPYRILGAPVNSTDRQLEKQFTNIALYADMGKEIACDLDSIFLNNPSRDASHIQEAKQSIELPHNKLFHATSWFWENSDNTIDDMAFEQIKSGNIEKAIEFWSNETEKEINSKNISNFKNLSTIHLGLSFQNGKFDKFHFMTGLALLGNFLEDAYFREFSNKVLGDKHSVSLQETSNLIIDEILSSIKPFIGVRKSGSKITNKELLTCFKSFPDFLKNDISEKFIGGPIQKIEERIKTCKNNRENGQSNDGQLGYKLWEDSSKDLMEVQSVLSKSDLKYQLLADKLAEELLGCSISHFNKHFDSGPDPGEICLQLLKYSKSIAVGDKTKDRIANNEPTIKEYVATKSIRDKAKIVKNEMDYIYRRINELDNSTKVMDLADDAEDLLSDCKPKLNKIKRELGSGDENFKNASDNLVQCALNACITIWNAASEVGDRDESFMRAFFQIHYPIIVRVFNDAKKFTMSPNVKEYHSRNYKILRIGDHPDSKSGTNYSMSPDPDYVSNSSYSSSSNSDDDGGAGWIIFWIVFAVFAFGSC